MEHELGNVGSIKLLNTSEMEKEPVPGAEGIGKYELGGEGVNSSKLRGEHRIFENPHFSSPTSKKISEKSQSVARVRKIFLASSEKGGGGENETDGVIVSDIQNIKKQENTHVVAVKPQNWRQKLLAFRAET